MTEQGIADILRTDYPDLSPETPIRRAAALLAEARASATPVVTEDGGLAGILSQKDCFRPALNASYYREWKGCVADYMARDVVTVDVTEELFAVSEMFLSHPHRVFPALQNSRVAGLVHRSDVLARLVQLG